MLRASSPMYACGSATVPSLSVAGSLLVGARTAGGGAYTVNVSGKRLATRTFLSSV